MNTVIISGLVGSDSKLDYTQGGLAILSFSLAYSEKKGAEYTPAEWWSCKLFGKHAEAVHNGGYAPKKGDKAVVCGKVQLREYQAKDGTKKTNHDILVEEFKLIPKQNYTITHPEDERL